MKENSIPSTKTLKTTNKAVQHHEFLENVIDITNSSQDLTNWRLEFLENCIKNGYN